ncbi:MAG TPA: hypothetical protein PKM72_14555 [Nitrospirales bacterium]|nr:hypothetical protein [Nitrospirales bacterium]
MKKNQITKLEGILQHSSWLEVVLGSVPVEDQESYREKSHDLLVQLLCFHKLHAFIHQGIKQENIQVSGDALVAETDKVVELEAEEIKRQIFIELDLVETEDGPHSL